MDNKFTDPKAVGAGLWWYIHSKAKEATTEELIDEFIDIMNYFAKKFPCQTCRKHIIEYIKTHQPQELRNLTNEQGERIGMFKWSWLFHNAVNTRIGKPYVDWETAIGMFYNDDIEICSINCHEADGHSTDVLTFHEPSIVNSVTEPVDNYENPTLVNPRYHDKKLDKKSDKKSDKKLDKKSDKKLPIKEEKQKAENRKSKLVQGYFMSVGIPKTLEQQGIVPNLPMNNGQITIK